MTKRALLIDAFSTVHVGNGALIDNTYKLVDRVYPGNVDVLTIDTKPNVGRFSNVYEDLFVDYRGGKWGKLKVAILVFLIAIIEVPNAFLFKGKVRFPWGARVRTQLDIIQRSDCCVSLSGETINDHYFPHMYLRLIIYWIAILQGKKFVLFPQSIGPIFRRRSIALLRLCLGKAAYVVARDMKSLETAKMIWEGCPIKVTFSPDVAVTQDSKRQSISCAKTGKRLVGLTVSDIPREEMGFQGEYLECIVSAVKKSIDAAAYEIVLMPSNYIHGGISNDYRQCLKAKEMLEQSGYDVSIIENKIYHPDFYQGMQKSLFAFITTRMHVGILGTSAAVPTVMINTQHKIRAYMNLIGREDCVVELKELDSNLSQVIEYVLRENERLRGELESANFRLRDEVLRVTQMVLS